MKQFIFLLGLLFFSTGLLNAQKDYKVVFDLTSKDTLDQQALLRWTREVSNATQDARVEVVMYGKGVNLVAKDRTQYAEAITKLLKNKNVSFKVCAVAMKAQGIDKTQLIPGVEIVPDGIYEIISKQREGWGYIKAVH
ncbi:MAG: DsrE family protein [Bacteroidetes bacterium]|nr:DsrE family protein [Bacteroidota bacterium]MBS1930209.1 DsrE family protein [Bacteroidota bacterium]